jgi:multiple sugar transport system ATP-binding protein
MAGITLESIGKTYPGGVVAVKDFNLTIEDKEFIVLVGPSGCGKSTVLRMIAGLEEITEGKLYIGDKLVNTVAPKDRNIAMVFQNYALYPHMTVYKNMAFSLTLSKTPKNIINQKVHEAAKILDIEHLLARRPKALSGGQRQRVALGRAMVRDPAVFLLDEPLSNLDAKLRASMRAELAKLHKNLGTTFVYVTHDQTEAITMGDRIVVMNNGSIQQVDTPQNLYNKPNNLFVAGFIGTPPMNLISGKIVRSQTDYIAQINGNIIPIPQTKVPKDKLAHYEDKEVVIGIRPENLYLDSSIQGNGTLGSLEVTVDLAEMMGSELYIYAVYQNSSLISKAPVNSGVKSGDSIKFIIDSDEIHLFDKETGMAIK